MEHKPVTSLVGDLADPTEVEDDLGGAAEPESDTETGPDAGTPVAVNFNYRNVAYTIELDPERAELFDRAMAPYIAASRRIGGIRAEPARSREPSENQAIRAWAAENGIAMNQRGRIPNAVREQFRAARKNARHQPS